MNKSYPKAGAPVNTAAASQRYEQAPSGIFTAPSIRYDLTPTVEAMGRLHFGGNLIPHSWYQHPALRFEDGKANLVAITILADICYWYRPTITQDEMTGAIRSVTKKFAADKLQWDHAQRGDRFGLTKRQVQDAFALLKARGIISVEIRERWTLPSGTTLYNVVFVEPVVEAIATLCALAPFPQEAPQSAPEASKPVSEGVSRLNGIPPTFKRDTPPGTTDTPSRSNGTPLPLKREPSTKNTTKTSPETLNVVPAAKHPPDLPNPGAGSSPGQTSTFNVSEGIYNQILLGPVVAIEELTGDTRSRDRFVQLREICLRQGQGDAWDIARAATERRMKKTAEPLENPGAYFNAAVVRELDKRGIPIMPAGSGQEQEAVRGLVAASLGLTNPKETPGA